ncbi:hypothetical protein GCM10009839_18630 [Catenulispora yoronensis]|uniref:Uncharacterized protein n=1 Tax=Catenulispora yoronensis TaxID=450799 RepID=A0ABN2TU65_9ACTN
MHATHAVLASAVALSGGKSWWNRPMVWASLAAICYGGWLAARRAQRRAEREEAEDDADLPPHPAVTARTTEGSQVDEAMNRLGRDWHPEEPAP